MNTPLRSVCRNLVAAFPATFRPLVAALSLIPFLLLSCDSDNLDDDAMYTFTGETIVSFCQNTPELTDFARMIEESGTAPLLSVYGHFTCFPPTNAAIASWLSDQSRTWEDLTKEEMQKIVYSSTIRNEVREFMTTDFEEGAIQTPSLQDRFVVVSFQLDEDHHRQILVNKSARIVSADNEVHNGVLHVVDRVIEPSEEDFLQRLQRDGRFSLFAAAFEATGFNNQMRDLYDPTYQGPAGSDYERCKLGWTVFAEPDDVLANAGLTTSGSDRLKAIEQFASQWYGTEAQGDYTNPSNALHRFIAYHILNRQMSTSSFVYTGFACAPTYRSKAYEYYETMLPNRLMEIKAGNEINRQRNGQSVRLDESTSNLDVANGFIHTLQNLLVYDETIMRTDVLHKRIRFDFYSPAPQLTNNNIRWQLVGTSGTSVPQDFCGDYFWYNTGSTLTMWASNDWSNYQADEMLISGPMYDFTLRMLPVPPGNYEIRLGYRAENWRGIAQLFIDGQIAGIPVDLTIGYNGAENDPRIGYVHDDDTADDGVENDKMMRNHGYMKAPNSIYTGQEGGKTLRDMSACLRIIIGQYSFQDYAPHYFRAKNMDDKGGGREFHADYLEYIPIDLLRDEDRE